MTAALAAPTAPPRRRRSASAVRLAWLLARPGASSPATILLPATAFAVTTALLLTVVGGAAMFFRADVGLGLEVFYPVLASIAAALLVVPLVSLGGAAARLSARRRDDRLSALRLLGATPGLVARVTIVESTAVAAAGAVAGIALYGLLLPAVGLIPFLGGPIGARSLWVGVPVLAGAVLLVAVVAAISAAVSLRAVVVSPLGVLTRARAPRLHWLRAVVAVLVIGGAALLMGNLAAIGQLGASLSVVVGILAMVGAGLVALVVVIAVLNLVGPWVIGIVARVQARRAPNLERLVAARSVLESPAAAWRQVSGLAMTSFVAVVAGSGMAMMTAGLQGSENAEDAILAQDVRTGVILTLVMSFLMVACSVGVTQASQILDRRDLAVGLDRLGVPRRTLDRARWRAIRMPLLTVVLGSAGVGAVFVLPLLGAAMLFAPLSMLVIAASFVVGYGLVALAFLATRPVTTALLASGRRSAAG